MYLKWLLLFRFFAKMLWKQFKTKTTIFCNMIILKKIYNLVKASQKSCSWYIFNMKPFDVSSMLKPKQKPKNKNWTLPFYEQTDFKTAIVPLFT